jgi:hypothetical protein
MVNRKNPPARNCTTSKNNPSSSSPSKKTKSLRTRVKALKHTVIDEDGLGSKTTEGPAAGKLLRSYRDETKFTAQIHKAKRCQTLSKVVKRKYGAELGKFNNRFFNLLPLSIQFGKKFKVKAQPARRLSGSRGRQILMNIESCHGTLTAIKIVDRQVMAIFQLSSKASNNPTIKMKVNFDLKGEMHIDNAFPYFLELKGPTTMTGQPEDNTVKAPGP